MKREKPRPIKELLIIVRDNVKKCMEENPEIGGMCIVIYHLWGFEELITEKEYDTICGYLNENKPNHAKIREKRYKKKTDKDGNLLGLYWWRIRAIAPRLKWLNEQINSIDN